MKPVESEISNLYIINSYKYVHLVGKIGIQLALLLLSFLMTGKNNPVSLNCNSCEQSWKIVFLFWSMPKFSCSGSAYTVGNDS